MAAAGAGGGIALLPAAFAGPRGLIEVPAPIVLPGRTPWSIAHRDLRRLPPIRAAHAWIVGTFAALPSSA